MTGSLKKMLLGSWKVLEFFVTKIVGTPKMAEPIEVPFGHRLVFFRRCPREGKLLSGHVSAHCRVSMDYARCRRCGPFASYCGYLFLREYRWMQRHAFSSRRHEFLWIATLLLYMLIRSAKINKLSQYSCRVDLKSTYQSFILITTKTNRTQRLVDNTNKTKINSTHEHESPHLNTAKLVTLYNMGWQTIRGIFSLCTVSWNGRPNGYLQLVFKCD